MGDLGDMLPTDLMDQMPELSEDEANEIFESLMEECDTVSYTHLTLPTTSRV